MLTASGVRYIYNHSDYLRDESLRSNLKMQLQDGFVFIAKNVIDRQKLIQLKEYLAGVGKSSLPNYHKIEFGAPNFHRVNFWDKRSYVTGCFHQFSFFPWNQDIFNLFNLTREVYHMRNLLSDLDRDSFLDSEPVKSCTARLSVQFYPKGSGGLNQHIDPYDFHQFVVPIVIMTQKGVDFRQGGAYVVDKNDNHIILDDFAEIGDVVYFSSQLKHGVDTIDPDEPTDWYSFQGRWMLLIAINRLNQSNIIADSIDLEKIKVTNS